MELTVYHLKNCDTCKKAIKSLADAGHELTLVDVRADGMPKAALEVAANSVGWQNLLNTRSTTWRGLPDADKADISETKALALMREHPTLIKRPVIVSANTTTVGWDRQTALHHGA